MTKMVKQDKNIENFPNLRFPGFEGEWETMRLGDVMDFKVTNSFSRENLNYETGNIKNIHYGDIHTKFQTLFDIKKEFVPYINEEISLNKISEDCYCQEGDIVFADASEDLNDVGKSIEIVNLNGEKLLSGLHTLLARPDKQYFYKGFNGFLFKSKNVRYQIQKESQGSKVLSINVGRICKIKLSFPSKAEQEKITSLISLVEKRIYKSMKIISHLETSIRSFREKVFSQKLRFKDELGNNFSDWEESKLENICQKQSSNISANKIEENFGSYTIYGASGILKKVDFYDEENEFVSIVKDGAGVGRLFLCEAKSSVLGTMDIIKPKSDVNIYYLFYQLSNIDFTKYVTGSTIPHIYFKDYKKEKLIIPSRDEQTKIANFLFSIDEKIETEKKILKQFENQKKYLLTNLFV